MRDFNVRATRPWKGNNRQPHLAVVPIVYWISYNFGPDHLSLRGPMELGPCLFKYSLSLNSNYSLFYTDLSFNQKNISVFRNSCAPRFFGGRSN